MPKGPSLSPDAESLLRKLQKIRRRLSRPDKLAAELQVDAAALEHSIGELVTAGLVVRARQGRVGLAARMGLVKGTVRVGRRGRGVVIPDEPDIPIGLPRDGVRPAMHGDYVLVELEPHQRRGLQRGSIKEILERGQTHIVGVVHGAPSDGEQLVVPTNARFGDPSRIVPDGVTAQPGNVVRAKILEYPTSYRSALVSVERVLGESGTLATEIESVRMSMGIDDSFSSAAEREASTASTPDESSLDEGRLDLRDQQTITIDPADARDFDDAVAIEHVEDGYRLTVSIADVSYYVRTGTALDREAADRATSVYLPGRCIPMLPERISGNLASLRPGEDRYAVSAILDIDATGQVRGQRFARSVIRSNQRLTYEEAEELLNGTDESPVGELVRLLWDCASVLLAQRMRRGAIDLDIPEPWIDIDDNDAPVGIHRRSRLRAHRLVEECMLAANEAVARTLEENDLPFLYRIHERPDADDVDHLTTRLSSLGLRLPEEGAKLQAKSIQALVEKARAKPFQRSVHVMILRAMTRARYDPYKQIHFGLASTCYTHFTSPIRRYPDLVVHRALCRLIEESSEQLPSREALVPVGVHCSERERRAAEAERELIKVAGILVMQSRVGESFDGQVTGIDRYGFFVELDEPFVEGFVPLARMPEYYEYIADSLELQSRTSSARIRIGDPIRVILTACDLAERRMELEPVRDD